MTEVSSRRYPDRPIVGVGAVVFSNAGVLLIQRGKPPRIGSWSLPGGAQELGETVYQSAAREVAEETELLITVIGLIDVVDSVTEDAKGDIEYHYTLVDVVADAEDDSSPRAGGDAANAKWVPMDNLEDYDLWSETDRIIRLGFEKWKTYRSLNDVDTEL